MDAAYGRIGQTSEGTQTLLAESPAFLVASKNASYERLRLSRWSFERFGRLAVVTWGAFVSAR